MRHLDIQKHISYKKNGINSVNILYTGSHPIMTYGGGFLKRILKYFYCTKCNEFNIFYSDKKKCFVYRITKIIFDILWAMFGNAWKCIFNFVSWFFLYDSILCDACAV